jgi:acetyl esterase/lipase
MKALLLAVLSLVVLASAATQKAPVQEHPGDQWLTHPVDNKTFQGFLDFFAYDKSLPLQTQVIDVKEQEGVRVEHLSFQSTSGVRVFAYFYRPAGVAPEKSPSVVHLHGGSPPGKDAPSSKIISELLARGGWNVLSIDMQYFGERSTSLMTTYTEQEKHERLYNQQTTYLAWVTQTVKDVSRSYDFLVSERGADPRRVGLVGFSRGAIVGAIVGGADNRFAVVALLYGAHFDALERGHFAAACPANFIGHISPRPLLMINGTQDTDHIKGTSVEPLYRLAKPPKQIIWANSGHQLPSDEHRAELLKWLRENFH